MTDETRIAGDGDISALVDLINRAFASERFFAKGDRITADGVRTRMETPGAAFLVLDHDDTDQLAGVVFVKTNGTRGYFGLLAVDPAAQGQGLARTLIDAAEEYCRAAGCEWLDIDVVDLRTELPPLYRKFGFDVSGTAPFPEPHKLSRPAHLIMMSKQIRGGR